MKYEALTCSYVLCLSLIAARPSEAQQTFTDEASFQAAVGPVTLIDFDTDPNGVPLGNNTFIDTQYLAVGVGFDSFNGGTPRTSDIAVCAITSPNSMKTVPFTGGGGGFAAVLSVPTPGIGMHVCDLNDQAQYGATFLEVFDSSGNSIAVYNLQNEIGTLSLGLLFFGVTSNTPIARMEVAIGSGDFVLFEDLQYGDVRVGSNYCGPAETNSSGSPAFVFAAGSEVAADNEIALLASGLPTNQFGYFLMSQAQGFVQNPGGSQGNLCLGSPIVRLLPPVLHSGAAGLFGSPIDITNVPQVGAIQAGETWNFTAWFRDNNPGPTSNFTDGVSVTFL